MTEHVAARAHERAREDEARISANRKERKRMERLARWEVRARIRWDLDEWRLQREMQMSVAEVDIAGQLGHAVTIQQALKGLSVSDA